MTDERRVLIAGIVRMTLLYQAKGTTCAIFPLSIFLRRLMSSQCLSNQTSSPLPSKIPFTSSALAFQPTALSSHASRLPTSTRKRSAIRWRASSAVEDQRDLLVTIHLAMTESMTAIYTTSAPGREAYWASFEPLGPIHLQYAAQRTLQILSQGMLSVPFKGPGAPMPSNENASITFWGQKLCAMSTIVSSRII